MSEQQAEPRPFPRREFVGAITADADGIYRVHRGQAEFRASKPMLADIAADMAEGLPEDWPHPAVINVGIHIGSLPARDDRPWIGIQTEHFRTLEGTETREMINIRMRRRAVAHYDHILDLTDLSRPYYEHIPPALQAKITYGPHVFPQSPVAFVPGTGGPAFVGYRHGRRMPLMAAYKNRFGITRIPVGVFGAPLREALKPARGVLNIHSMEGTYSEVPRMLKAYLCGKAMISEPLAPPFITGRHALPIDDAPTDEALERVFQSFSDEIASRHRLVDYLERILGVQ